MSANLAAFLRARLDEEWAAASPRVSDIVPLNDGLGYIPPGTQFDPRVLRQVEAGRAIVELSWHHLGDDDYAWGMEEAKRQVLCHLAAIYRDHPDYREEWAL